MTGQAFGEHTIQNYEALVHHHRDFIAGDE
jgi:hypothetical protein